MTESYAVVWRVGEGPSHVGKLQVLADGMHLSGSAGHRRSEFVVRSTGITGVDVQPPGAGVLGDMRTVTIDRGQAAPPITIGAVNGIGIVFEIADVVAELRGRRASVWSDVAVRVPIRPERAEELRQLVRHGPPFDPCALDGLDRHVVFVGEADVVFIFEGSNVQAAVEGLLRKPRVWVAATAWRECLAGRPVLVERAYAWSSNPPRSGV